jgi:hypothetical protein
LETGLFSFLPVAAFHFFSVTGRAPRCAFSAASQAAQVDR